MATRTRGLTDTCVLFLAANLPFRLNLKMFRVIAVTALAALAAAQSEFSASDGAINIETREGKMTASAPACPA